MSDINWQLLTSLHDKSHPNLPNPGPPDLPLGVGDDKWGPWMAFPLAAGGWCFHGWVNT